MHATTIFNDVFGRVCPQSGMLSESMKIIGEAGSGVIVFISPRPTNFFSSQVARLNGEKPADMDQLRDYGVGAQILTELGVSDMELLSNTSHDLVGLDAYGLQIVGQRAVPTGESADSNKELEAV
jgi:3,4-dihydroxy 2-butanone 4-phosphate synthase/GTP cyclohydrolase II